MVSDRNYGKTGGELQQQFFFTSVKSNSRGKPKTFLHVKKILINVNENCGYNNGRHLERKVIDA